MVFGRFNPRRLWIRYVAAIGLILTGVITAHVATSRIVETSRADAEIINLSGRQRMLSQRILLLAHYQKELLTHIRTPAPVAATELTEAIDEFEVAHRWLITNAVQSEDSRHLYFEQDGPRLHDQVARFVMRARAVADADLPTVEILPVLRRLEVNATGRLLTDLDAAVQLFEREAHARNEALRALNARMFLLALVTLGLEAVLVFLPAQVSLNRFVRETGESRTRIETANASLSAYGKRMEHAAHHDALTGLANRKGLLADLDDRLGDRRRGGRRICVMHVDLDRFKEVNDTLGHPVGDAVLRHAADLMRAHVRDGDVVARLGGDEFVILMDVRDDAPEASVQGVADAIIENLAKPIEVGGQTCHVGASIGFVFSAEDAGDAESLISRADIALYEAKRAGKGIAVPFTARMGEAMERRHGLIGDLERALAAGEFEAAFQPQVAFDGETLAGFEALSRWNHPERGVMLPAEFIDLAEETRLIDAIDGTIMCQALDQLADLHRRGWTGATMALNASGRILRDPGFAETLLDVIASRGLCPDDIVVEILETVLFEGTQDASLATVRQLSASGVGVVIDDFGTGYAAMAKLVQLDLTGLKIDRSLVDAIEDRKSEQVIGAIIGLARNMGLKVIAEGVETAGQFARLRDLGCDVAQGYGLGLPLSAGPPMQHWLDAFAHRGAEGRDRWPFEAAAVGPARRQARA